jgi:transcription initiation factor TFIIH subunit 3
MSFLPSTAIRSVLAVPVQDQVDLRASCFCHKDIVDIGYVCSVCLSSTLLSPAASLTTSDKRLPTVFCAPVPVCSTCRTKFPMKTLQRLNAARSAAPTPARTPSRGATPAPVTPRPPGTLPSSNSIQVDGRRG